MSRRQDKISPELKTQIRSALQSPGYVVSELAKLYGVSSWTIYKLRKQYREGVGHCASAVCDKFIELSVQDKGKPALEKAILVFKDMSLTIEGRIKGSDLLALVSVLETPC